MGEIELWDEETDEVPVSRLGQISPALRKTEEPVRLCALGSGSSGNSIVITAGEEALIVDLGFSRREILNRLKMLSLAPRVWTGALLTHEHSDHSAGCRVFCNEFGIPLCATPGTIAYLRPRGKLPDSVRAFDPGGSFHLGGFCIHSFALPHDAVEPVGFVVERAGIRIGIATDLGSVSEATKGHLRDCDALILESNYDRTMLMNSARELSLKRRICGPRGHLDNRECSTALAGVLSSRTKLLLLAHVSRECNDPQLVRDTCSSTLRLLGREQLHFEVLAQEEPSAVFPLFPEGEGA